MTLQQGISLNRLVHDFKEVLRNPIKNVAALPLEDDLFVWHGNGENNRPFIVRKVAVRNLSDHNPLFAFSNMQSVRMGESLPIPLCILSSTSQTTTHRRHLSVASSTLYLIPTYAQLL